MSCKCDAYVSVTFEQATRAYFFAESCSETKDLLRKLAVTSCSVLYCVDIVSNRSSNNQSINSLPKIYASPLTKTSTGYALVSHSLLRLSLARMTGYNYSRSEVVGRYHPKLKANRLVGKPFQGFLLIFMENHGKEKWKPCHYNEVDLELFDSPSFSNFANVKKIIFNFLNKTLTVEKNYLKNKKYFGDNFQERQERK